MSSCQVCGNEGAKFSVNWGGYICKFCLKEVEKDKPFVLSGCGAENGNEIDGREFECESLKDFIDILKTYKSVHLNFLGDEEIDLWIGRNE